MAAANDKVGLWTVIDWCNSAKSPINNDHRNTNKNLILLEGLTSINISLEKNLQLQSNPITSLQGIVKGVSVVVVVVVVGGKGVMCVL